MRVRTAIASIVVASLAGCASCDHVPASALTSCDQSDVGIGGVKTDILFVVDDSGSMSVHQQNLAANFQAFIQSMASSPVKNDIQFAVTTTSVDRNGGGTPPPLIASFQTPLSGCIGTGNQGHPYPAGAFVYTDPASVQSTTAPGRILAGDSPTLVTDFVRNVKVGTCGSGKEQPLRAMQLALSAPNLSGPNAGFLRPGARLAVVLVSDDDDCSDPGYLSSGTWYGNVPNTAEDLSGGTYVNNCRDHAEPVGDFVTFLSTAVGGEVRDTTVAVIGSFDPVTLQSAQCTLLDPNGNPTTTGAKAEAPAPRNWNFVSAFGAAGIKASICSNSFHDALQNLADQLVPQTFPLDGEPADWRLLTVARVRAGVTQGCSLALTGTPEAATSYAVYTPPQGAYPPTITMQSGCTLANGDAVQVHVVCIR